MYEIWSNKIIGTTYAKTSYLFFVERPDAQEPIELDGHLEPGHLGQISLPDCEPIAF